MGRVVMDQGAQFTFYKTVLNMDKIYLSMLE